MIEHTGKGSGGDTRPDSKTEALLEAELGGAIGGRRASRDLVREGLEQLGFYLSNIVRGADAVSRAVCRGQNLFNTVDLLSIDAARACKQFCQGL